MPDSQPDSPSPSKSESSKNQFELVVRLVEARSNPDPKPDRFAQTIELVKAIAWPLFGVLVLTAFWNPLYSTIQQLPNLVSRSENITLAGLTLKIERGLKQQASPEVREALSNLSAEGVEKLLNTAGEAYYWSSDFESNGRTSNAELVKLGLLEEIPAAELNSPDKPNEYGYGVRPTPLGREARTFLFGLVSEFIQELERTETDAP